MKLFWLSLFVVMSAGCASWHSDRDPSSLAKALPAPRKPADGAVLEVSFVSILPDDSGDDIWESIDETVVPAEERRALRRNGLRIGKPHKVIDFQKRLERLRRRPSSEAMETVDVQSELTHQSRRITFRVGKRYELPVRQPATEDRSVLVTLGDRPIGRTLSRMQPLFAIRATSIDVHAIRLSLRPEIQYGDLRQTWVGNDAALRMENRRESWVFDELATDVELEQGALLVAGSVTPAVGLGQHLFRGLTAEGDDDHVLMVIRVADLPRIATP